MCPNLNIEEIQHEITKIYQDTYHIYSSISRMHVLVAPPNSYSKNGTKFFYWFYLKT